MSTAHRGFENSPNDLFGSRDCGVIASQKQVVAVSMDGDVKRRFDG
jgi:hypothetical protein